MFSDSTAFAEDLFRVVLLNPLEAPQVLPHAWGRFKINNSGDVVGNRNSQAAKWKNGTITLLGVPSSATYSSGFDINDSGKVACQINNKDFIEENSVAIYSPPGNWDRTLFPSGDRFTIPSALNNIGFCVGFSSVGAGIPGRAFYLPPGSDTPIRLAPRSGDIYCSALGINNNSPPLICGVSFLGINNPTALIWDTLGNGQALQRFVGTTASGAMAVNDGNVAVGHCNVGTTEYAVYWDSTGIHVITIGVANDVNNSGVIIGSTEQTYSIASSLAWIKFPFDATVYNLTALQSDSTLTLNTADSVNSNLQIVGRCSSGGYIATAVLVRSIGGSWDTASAWAMRITPKSVHPVRLKSSNAITITGPTSATVISELTVSDNVRLEIQNVQPLSVVGNVFGNGNTLVTSSGTLVVNGQFTSPLTVNGVLAGNGAVNGNVVCQNGQIRPGSSVGTLAVNGSVQMLAGSVFSPTINGPDVASQQAGLSVDGTVSIANCGLLISGSYMPVAGDVFPIIINDGSEPINGTFGNLVEGATFTQAGVRFQITYQGGTGNDVVLTVLDPLTPVEQWRLENFGTAANTGDAADGADPDADNMPNILEYGLGTLPTASNTIDIHAARGASEMTLDFTTDNAATDVTVIVEASTDLGDSWSSSGVTYELLSNTGGRTNWRAHIPDPTDSSRRFARVKVSRP